jgi:hypothetical protein
MTPDRLTVVLPEVRDRLEVWRQPPHELDQLDVSLCLSLQPTARLDPLQITVDVDLEQGPRTVGRSSCRLWLRTFEAQRLQIQLVDEDIHYPNRVVIRDVVLQALGKQRRFGRRLLTAQRRAK